MTTTVFKGLLSILAVLIGSTIIVWVLDNEFIQRQPQFQRPAGAGFFGIGPIMVVCGLRWGWQSLTYFGNRHAYRAHGHLGPVAGQGTGQVADDSFQS